MPNNDEKKDDVIVIPSEEPKPETAANTTPTTTDNKASVSNEQNATSNVETKPEDKKPETVVVQEKEKELSENDINALKGKISKLEPERNQFSESSKQYREKLVKDIKRRAETDVDNLRQELLEDPKEYEVVRKALKESGDDTLPDYETFKKSVQGTEVIEGNDKEDISTTIDKRVKELNKQEQVNSYVRDTFFKFVKNNNIEELDPEKIGDDPEKQEAAGKEAIKLTQLAVTIANARGVSFEEGLGAALRTDPKYYNAELKIEKEKSEITGFYKARNLSAGQSTAPSGETGGSGGSDAIYLSPSSTEGKMYEELKKANGVDFANRWARRIKKS